MVDIIQPQENTDSRSDNSGKPSMVMGPAQILFRDMAVPEGGRVKQLLVILPHEPDKVYRLIADLDACALPEEEARELIAQVEQAMERQMARMALTNPSMPPHGMGGLVLPPGRR